MANGLGYGGGSALKWPQAASQGKQQGGAGALGGAGITPALPAAPTYGYGAGDYGGGTPAGGYDWRGSAAASPGAPTTGAGTGAAASLDYPAAQAYDPYGGGGELSGTLQQMTEYGQGLMDPTSDYYKQLQEEMLRQLGLSGEAAQRSSALRGAYGGFGAGASPERMQTTADIQRAGLEAQGEAAAGLALQAPELGAGIVEGTYGTQYGLEELGEASRQYGAGLGEQARQYEMGIGLEQQQLAAEQEAQQAELDYGYWSAGQQNQQFYDQMYADLAMSYGGY